MGDRGILPVPHLWYVTDEMGIYTIIYTVVKLLQGVRNLDILSKEERSCCSLRCNEQVNSEWGDFLCIVYQSGESLEKHNYTKSSFIEMQFHV